jgi:hypothetical protein
VDKALLIGILFSVPSYLFISSRKDVNILPFLLILGLPFLWLGTSYLLKTILFFIFLFLSFEVYEIFLNRKVRSTLFIFFLSFLVVLVSYGISPLPVLIGGIFTGKTFSRYEHFQLSRSYQSYKYLILLFLFFQIEWNWPDVWQASVLVGVLALLGYLSTKNLKGTVWRMPVEFPLSFYPFSLLGMQNFIFAAVWIALLLLAVLELCKAGKCPVLSGQEEPESRSSILRVG